MSSVRVLVGTKKGAFILTSDGTRNSGMSAVLTLADGSCTISKGRPPIPIDLCVADQQLVRASHSAFG